MLRRRILLVLALAVTMGLITSILVYQAVKSAQAARDPTEEIVVAGVNIGLGETLMPQHVKMAAWPKSALPAGSLRSVKEIEGRVARTSILAGEPILEAKLAPAGQGGLMPVLVPYGKRAVTIKVDEAIQKSGFVLPNSRVDVVVTMARKIGEGKESRIVLQDVAVLAADQTVEMKDNKPVTMTTVTLAISPEGAERLALAQNEGKVTLALRNVQDGSLVSTRGVTTAQLLGGPAPAPAPPQRPAGPLRSRTKQPSQPVKGPEPEPVAAPPSPPTHTVSVIKGVNSTEYLFSRDAERGWVESPGKTDAAKKSR